MKRTKAGLAIALLGAAGVTVWLSAVAGKQATTEPPALSDALRAHVKDERFGIVTSIRGLPLGVREALQTLFESGSLDIAEPDAEFQATSLSVSSALPTRRLVAAGCSSDHCLVYYERGGTNHTWHAALFRWTPAETRFEAGGIAPRGLAAIADVKSALLSGTIKSTTGPW